jgi:hypothetical protein
MDVFDLRTYLVLALECQVCVVNAILWHFPVIDMYAILFTTICHLKHALRTWIDCGNPDNESTWRHGVKKITLDHWRKTPRLSGQNLSRFAEFKIVRRSEGVVLRQANGLPSVRLLSGAFQEQLCFAIDNLISHINGH